VGARGEPEFWWRDDEQRRASRRDWEPQLQSVDFGPDGTIVRLGVVSISGWRTWYGRTAQNFVRRSGEGVERVFIGGGHEELDIFVIRRCCW